MFQWLTLTIHNYRYYLLVVSLVLAFFECRILSDFWGGDPPEIYEFFYLFLVIHSFFVSLFYLAANAHIFFSFKRIGARREILESKMDSKLIGIVPNLFKAQDKQRRLIPFLIGAAVGGGLCLIIFLFMPDLRCVLFSIGGLFHFLILAIVQAIFFGCAGDMIARNKSWISTLLKWKKQHVKVDVKMPEYPSYSGNREFSIVIGEQHDTRGKRVADPKWVTMTEAGLRCGMLVLGDTGSGKSTGCGLPWLETMIKSNIGGLVLDGAGSYVRFVQKLMKDLGRESDLIVLDLDESPWRYNPLAKPGMRTLDLAAWIHSVISNLSAAQGKSENEQFWESSSIEYSTVLLDMLRLYSSHCSLDLLYKLSVDDSMQAAILESFDQEMKAGVQSDERRHQINHILDFFRKQWPKKPPNMRGSIPALLNSVCTVFSSDFKVNQKFCPHPDAPNIFTGFDNAFLDSSPGRVVLLNLNANTEIGRIVGSFLKLDFQTAMLRRTAGRSESDIKTPVFMFVDECHRFVSSSQKCGDSIYLAEARKARPLNFYMTQSSISLLNALKDQVTCDTFLTNIRSKLVLSQEHPDAQEFAAKICGKDTTFKLTYTEGEMGRSTELSYALGGLVHGDSAVSLSKSYQQSHDFIFQGSDIKRLPSFVGIFSPFDGSKKLEPRIVFLKPMFINSDGEVTHRERRSWYEMHPEYGTWEEYVKDESKCN
jgi:hypothetical protein